MASLEMVAQVLAVLGEVYNIELSRSLVKTYHLVLRDIDDSLIESALAAWLAKSKWFPKPAELREEAFNSIKRCYLSADEAWAMVLHRAETHGFYRKPEFDDEIVEQAANLTGWRDICYTEYSQLHYVRNRFERIYTSLVERQETEIKSLPAGERTGSAKIKQLADNIQRRQNDTV